MYKSSQELVQDALAAVRTVSAEEAIELHRQVSVRLVDLRESGELRRSGSIPGAFHAPRGLIEFWFDPTPGLGKPELIETHTTYVLFCAAGWRSALAAKALQEMGVLRVCHIAGGFEAWRLAGGVVSPGQPE